MIEVHVNSSEVCREVRFGVEDLLQCKSLTCLLSKTLSGTEAFERNYGELDQEYRKRQMRKWRTFVAMCSLTAASLLGCVGFKVGETMTTKSSYEGYIKEAANSPEQSEREKYYTDAIKIDPRRGEAYHNLLQLCIRGADGSENDFDREETARLTSVLGYKGSGNRTNESYFEGNKEEYDEFAFQMGLAYFYSYEGGEKSGKSMSQTWFEKAAESESLDKDKKELSKRFASIAAYYASLDSVDESGYSTTSYGDYWIDLVSLTDGDLTSVVNPETALVMYKELVYRIDENALDVKLFFVAEKEHAGRMHLFRFLPGAYCAQTDTRGIVTDDESKTLIFEYLYKELTMRAQEKRLYPHLLVFFYDEYGYKKHPISQFTEKGKDLGVTFLFFGQTRADIPVGCDYVVQLSGGHRGVLINASKRSKTVPFVSSQISDTLAVRIVRTLAPVCTDEVSLEGELTKNISMFKMLNILSVEDLDLKARWSASKVTKSMAAPVGVSKTGIVMLDLHDKAHGPHGLVAGTTGSGKSEILQTYILSMATLYHPYEAAFVIIDFKGGGMVNQFAQLPHLLGAITNIDGNAINRSLKSIKAELQKRQKYFAQADVNHIDKYIRKYKAGEVSEPLPHLIIIVDEFAELKAEQPEFMKELISAARIGRSLGVHLILATQKPAGQVNEQIWSNSRFKLCLKVQSKEDSNEVLKSPLAAEIKEPGRAYLQVGNNEIFELFQSAYSGAPEREDEGTGKAFTIYEVPDGGKKVPVYVKKKNKGQEGMKNQLEAIVSYVSEYFRSIQIPQLPDICLPPLGECIEFPPVSKEAVQEQKKEVGFYAWIGVYDDPDHQNQDQYAVNLSAGNMIIIGSAQTGKTTILQNVIRSLSEQYTPDEVAIYIIDFASMVLKNFETLNHVGGVVSSSEDEKLKNLFKMLWEEMETRKEKLLSVGVSSFVAYKEAGRTDMKQIVLIIDNLTALKELYFQDDDELLNLCREGITVGISIVIANAQTAGIGYKYLSSFSNRIALFCNDGNEYSAIFEHCNRRLEHLPGRCFAEVDKQILECQAYLPFAGEKEFERAEAIRGYIEKRNGECTEVARKIPLIPPVLSMNYMAQQFGNMMRGHFDLAAGLNYEDVMPYMLRMSSIGVLAVVGREGSGRHNWIKYVADMMELMYPGRSKVYISDGIGKKLASMKEKGNVVRYSMIAEDIVSYLKEIEEELQSRYELLAKGIESDPAEADYMLLIIDNPDAIEQISNSKEALASYKNIIGRYRNMNVGVIISAIENAPIPYSAPEVIKGIRDGRHLMYFGDISELKIYDMPLAVTRKFKKPIETGDGYYIKENECIKLKTPFIAGE